MLDCRRLFELDHNAGAATDQFTAFGDVGGTLDERKCDPIRTMFEGEGEISAVLLRDRRKRQFRIRHIDPLAVGQCAAYQTTRIGISAAAILDLEPYPTVIEEELGSRPKRLKDLGMRQRRTVFIAHLAIKIEVEACTGGEFDPTLGEGAKSELWSLQVGKYADRAPCCAFNPSDRVEARSMILLRAMAEIEPKYIDACLEECADPFRGGARWSQCRNDLGTAPTPQVDHSLACLSREPGQPGSRLHWSVLGRSRRDRRERRRSHIRHWP